MSSVVEPGQRVPLHEASPLMFERLFAEEALRRHRCHVQVSSESERCIKDALRVVQLFSVRGDRLGSLHAFRGLESVSRPFPGSVLALEHPGLVVVRFEPGCDDGDLVCRFLLLAATGRNGMAPVQTVIPLGAVLFTGRSLHVSAHRVGQVGSLVAVDTVDCRRHDGASGGVGALDKHQLHLCWLAHTAILRHVLAVAVQGLGEKRSLWHIVRHGAVFARQAELPRTRACLRIFHGAVLLREHRIEVVGIVFDLAHPSRVVLIPVRARGALRCEHN